MKPQVASQLLELNRRFYEEFAAPFSATRQRQQPGTKRLLENIPLSAELLDLGCGNGRLARELAQRGHQGTYLGIDQSPALLEVAQQELTPGLAASFYQADLAEPGWDQVLGHDRFDIVLCLAMLHHLPGIQNRERLLQTIHNHLVGGGQLMLSVWQFLQNERLRERVQPWEKAGLNPSDVDPGDYLLDWRQGGYGLRYVHHFDQEELQSLADHSGFVIQNIFMSDGQNGRLSLYQIWRKSGDG